MTEKKMQDDGSLKMIEIPSGEIMLRDDRIKKKWLVKIDSFLMSSTPVTQELYYIVTGKSPSQFKGNLKPVESVSWLDAVDFCNSLSRFMGMNECYSFTENEEEMNCDFSENGFRLPTDAEWEYACKAGKDDVRYGELGDIAWYTENSSGHTNDVGQKLPNHFGLFDMLGNVWEWCNDIYDREKYGTYRILRGGGWSDSERGCLATNRRRSHPTFAIDDLGFRIVRSVEK